MKKIIAAAFVLSGIVNTTSAQLYFRAGAGYAFPQAGQSIDGTGVSYNGSLNVNIANNSQAYSIKGASLSAGVQSVIGLGYLFTDHIGIQLDASVGLSNHKYTFTESNINIGGVLGNVSYIQQAKTPLIAMPSLILQTGGSGWNIYSRFGIALPLNTKISQDEVVSNAPGTGALTVDDLNFQIKNSFSLGFTAAAGVQYKFNDRVSIWGEVSLLSMSVFIKEAELKSWTENGQNVPLSNYAPYPTTVKYSKNATVDTTIGNANQPTYAQPFSNVGINLGISFRLSDRRSHGHRDNDMMDDNKNFKRKRF